MKFPNAHFGNGPGTGADLEGQREMEAYERNRLQMTVATSTFAGIALVGMFCSCLWFVCCRNSSSKTRKKPRTWASAEAGLQNNPYSYDGYLEAQGSYMQMQNNGMSSNGDDGIAPYLSNPLYHPNSLGADNGIPNPYDFNSQFGLSQQSGGPPNKAQLSQLFCGTTDLNPKDVPPSYTALFFATSDSATTGGKGVPGGNGGEVAPKTGPRVTSIQPIHLKVTSSADKQKIDEKDEDDEDDQMNEYFNNGFLNGRPDPSAAPPESLLSVESDPGIKGACTSEQYNLNEKLDKNEDPNGASHNKKIEKPPPYNPGYKGYQKF